VRTEIPLSFKATPLGIISDPRIPVTVATTRGQQTFEFLLDTGADFSLAPRALAEQIGLNWLSLPAARIVGVERTGAIAKVGELPIRIGARALRIRCVFLDISPAQFVLGRADFLDHFVVTIDQPGHKIVLEDVPGEPTNGQ
jgi:predicted aspartyl protease